MMSENLSSGAFNVLAKEVHHDEIFTRGLRVLYYVPLIYRDPILHEPAYSTQRLW